MNFDLILLDNPCLDDESRDVLALITLKLNDLAKLLIIHNSTITAKRLLKVLKNLVVTEFFLEPLHSCQAFPSIPLLNANMHILFSRASGVCYLSLREWVERCGDLDIGINHVPSLWGKEQTDNLQT